ncbi:hypothetical protein [Luteococcus sp. OSA5]|uniref:hypothetical protein n=1 Tax=Luteococcus sp. OSA5 TaxID=3401630 RepID=UPI003B430FC2
MTGFLLVLGVGLALLAVAAWRDRLSRRTAQTTVGAPLECLEPPSLASPSEAQRAALTDFCSRALRLDARLGDPRFGTWDDPPTLELAPAEVLCCPEGVGSQRELLPSIARARGNQRPLLLACPSLPDDLVAVLSAGRARQVFWLRASAAVCGQIAEACGGEVVGRADLQSGAATAAHGELARVVATDDGCWLARES